jgi:hypothetical protein
VLIRNGKVHGDSHENKASLIFSFSLAQLLGNTAKIALLLDGTSCPKDLITFFAGILLLIPYSFIYFNKKYFVDSKLYREIRDYHNVNSSKAWAKFFAIFFMCFSILSFLLFWPSSGWKK